jgi:hypothetical protein
MGSLKVQPPQGIFDRKRKVILYKDAVDARVPVTVLLMRFQKIATLVPEYVRIDDQQPLQRCLCYLHTFETITQLR